MTDTARQIVLEHAAEGARLRERYFQQHADHVVELARQMALTLARGRKIMFCGNGGSAADAQHLAAEFVNRFMMERPPLPALALTTDTSILTAIGNDYGFEQVFQKQVQALGQAGDMLVGISTSGNSPNVVLALKAAREKGVTTVGMTGRGGGEMAPLCDYLLDVSDRRTPLVQEIHITVGHLLCQLTDHFLFENVLALQPYLEGSAPE
ncbi:D-sedoheptulose 7-phosphate isomerase [Nitratidesulfovibrio sp. 1201_IL3209]|uniref:D-sedoheptulose 7-phosphate isomerase n=1 Tax=Nitratidesulfovibrio sp. 1201_IL3209 TaxID=3084053 RepID=UPI002FDAC36D